MNSNTYELNLSSDAFNAFKTDFNLMLRQILFAMENKEAEEGTMAIKFAITFDKENVPDFSTDDPDAQREITRPAFKHTITSQITLKSQTTGHLKGDYELVWDKETSSYIIKPIDNGQTSIFDAENDIPTVNEPPALPAAIDLEEVTDKFDEVVDTIAGETVTDDDYDYEPAALDD